MRITLLLISLLLAITSCKKKTLDSLAFPSEKLDSYQFENYADAEIVIPDSLQIEPSERTLLTFDSYSSADETTYKIYGVYIGDLSTIDQDTVILYFHGQSKHMDNYYTRASLLANLGGKYNYGVLMIDYRGYGMSEGECTEQGLYEDAATAISWLKGQGVNNNQIVVYGYSLGAIPAIDRCAYEANFNPIKLILESPLASVENLVQNSTVLNVSPGYMTTLQFPNAEKIKLVNTPLSWYHGKEDTYIAISNGELIFENHSGTKEAHRIDNSDHSEIPTIMGYNKYMEGLLTFIRN